MRLNLKFDSIYLGSFFLISLCSVNTHTLLPFPPPVLFLIIALIIMLNLIVNENRYIDVNSFLTIPIFIILWATQITTDAPFKRMLAPIIVQLFFFAALYYLPKLNRSQLKRIVKYFIILSVIVLFFDTLYRFVFPNYDFQQFLNNSNGDNDSDIRWIYMFKGSSLVYVDSNGTALHGILVLFFVYYWAEVVNKKMRIVKYSLILIILLTFSRAAWLGTFIGLLYYHFIRNRTFKELVFPIIILSLLIIYLGLFYVIPKIQNDLSLNSKFDIFNEVLNYYSNNNSLFKLLLTGVGMSMTKEVLGIYAHNYWLVWLLESGIIVTILHAFFWIYLILKTDKKALVVLIPFFIASSSSNLTFAPVFYVVLAVMYTQNTYKILY